jgi:hypothetical protein
MEVPMCRRVSCSDCGKPTFKGCGDHVEQVLGHVPPQDRCRCREQAGETQSAQAAQAA